MARATDLELATFTPLEAHLITGVSQATQRDWRRREVLGAKKGTTGWNRFTSDEIASLLILNRLLPDLRPGSAWFFTRGGWSVVEILARRTYGPNCRMNGEKLGPEKRFQVRATHTDGMRFFLLNDLSELATAAREDDQSPKRIFVPEKRRDGRYVDLKHVLITHYVIIDLFGYADELEARQLKPYFVKKGQNSEERQAGDD
jgi:hypothetical protein